MATAWRDVFQRGRTIARQLRQKERSTTLYKNNHGKPVKGWKLYSLGGIPVTATHRGPYGTYNYVEKWGDNFLVLGIDGVIYEYTLRKTEYGAGTPEGNGKIRIDESPSIFRMDPRTTRDVANTRLSSDRVMEALNRLSGGK